jgi:hypothetical protein
LSNLDLSNLDLSNISGMQQPATQTTQQTQQTQSPDNSGLYPGMDATQVSEIDDYFRNNSNISSLGQYQNPYFTGDGFTDGQQDAAGVIPGAGAAANATTNASTNPNAGQDWYENMTDEQRDAYDAFIANGGIYGGGFVNIPGTGVLLVTRVQVVLLVTRVLQNDQSP